MLRLLARDPSLVLRGPGWLLDVAKRHPLEQGGRPWVITDPSLRTQDYQEWCDVQAARINLERRDLLKWLRQQSDPPLISVLMPVSQPQHRWLRQAIAAVVRQIGRAHV